MLQKNCDQWLPTGYTHRRVNMATIEEHNKSMTVFYFKRTGAIRNVGYGILDMSFYGEYEEDYSLIIDYVVVDRDEFVFDRIGDFKIDVETKQLVCVALEQYRLHI